MYSSIGQHTPVHDDAWQCTAVPNDSYDSIWRRVAVHDSGEYAQGVPKGGKGCNRFCNMCCTLQHHVPLAILHSS